MAWGLLVINFHNHISTESTDARRIKSTGLQHGHGVSDPIFEPESRSIYLAVGLSSLLFHKISVIETALFFNDAIAGNDQCCAHYNSHYGVTAYATYVYLEIIEHTLRSASA